MGAKQQALWLHPNYRQPEPLAYEDEIGYTLRCVAHLISPPQEDGEDVEIACVDLAQEVLALEAHVRRMWRQFWEGDHAD